MTHHVPNGLAIRPMQANAAHDAGCVPIPPCGACNSSNGNRKSALMAKHQGISSNIVERGVATRVTMMATDQEKDAPSRKAWPISVSRDDQSIAHGLIRTTTPARPNPAAIQRRG